MKVLRYICNNKSGASKAIVLKCPLEGNPKVFSLNNELAIDETASAILGEVTVESLRALTSSAK